ncbi:MAG: aminodeoxychorismate synthase component I [Thermodesulfobacteriaceae bacterium]|nr:aminodeoxychorismate synthase component I [Thermodesulfobacteriaceae bacterium]
MNSFLWINAKKIPYQVWDFGSPLEKLILYSPEEITSFFEKLESFLKKGYYLGGFFSYELGYFLEKKLERLGKPFYEFPLAYFSIFKKPKNFSKFPQPLLNLEKDFQDLSPNLKKEDYLEAIEKIKKYISQGDTYQVNYTFKIKFTYRGNLEKLFDELLFRQRCEYAFFIQEKDWAILSLSPELFMKKKGTLIVSSPMKGTIKRGNTLSEDFKNKNFLKRDLKNQAENVMIVDLIRNDLGRVCKPGSVYVSEYFKIKTYPTLHQMISTVKGTLNTNNFFEILKALFPCGSVTGAPKIRTMEIIQELEKEERRIYTGAIGFITPRGDFLFNVAIRTLLFWTLDENFYKGEVGIGGGIVWDSVGEKEYEEALLKAKFFTHTFPYFELIESIYLEPYRKNPLLPLHFKRLKTSARYFGFKIPKELLTFEHWKSFIENKVKVEKPSRIRILLSPSGDLKFEIYNFEPWKNSLKIGLKKRDFPQTPFLYHKTTHRQEYDFYRKEALKLNLEEIVFYDEEGFLLEGTISNIFIDLGDEVLYTPPIELGLLNGVLRSYLISQKRVKKRKLKIEDLKKAKGIYLGNAVRGLGKVSEWIIL